MCIRDRAGCVPLEALGEMSGPEGAVSYGIGKSGFLKEEMTIRELAVRVKDVFGLPFALVYGLSLIHIYIPRSCTSVAGLDTIIAVMAGIAIFPAVFSFGLEPGQGPGLIFGALPKVFASIKGGSVFAILFFALVLFAAVTSAIALLEVVVSFAVDSLK